MVVPDLGLPEDDRDRSSRQPPYEVMAHTVMAYIVMAHIVMAHIVMAHVIMAHIVMLYVRLQTGL